MPCFVRSAPVRLAQHLLAVVGFGALVAGVPGVALAYISHIYEVPSTPNPATVTAVDLTTNDDYAIASYNTNQNLAIDGSAAVTLNADSADTAYGVRLSGGGSITFTTTDQVTISNNQNYKQSDAVIVSLIDYNSDNSVATTSAHVDIGQAAKIYVNQYIDPNDTYGGYYSSGIVVGDPHILYFPLTLDANRTFTDSNNTAIVNFDGIIYQNATGQAGRYWVQGGGPAGYYEYPPCPLAFYGSSHKSVHERWSR